MQKEDSALQKLNELEIIVKFKVADIKINGIGNSVIVGNPEIQPLEEIDHTKEFYIKGGRKKNYSMKIIRMVVAKEKPTKELAKILGVHRKTILKYRTIWKKKYFKKPDKVIRNTPEHYEPRTKRQKNPTTDIPIIPAEEIHY